MARRIREEYVDETDPVAGRRRVVTERRVDGACSLGPNLLAIVISAALVVFIIVMIFGYLI